LSAQDFFVQTNAYIYIGENAEVQAGGDFRNNGSIDNLGIITLYRDWFNTNFYNGLNGGFNLRGNGSQTIQNQNLQISELIVDTEDSVVLEGETEVMNLIDFRNGILTSTGPLIVDNSARVEAAMDGRSYYDGQLILEGGNEPGDTSPDTDFKFFPVGSDGKYNPLWLIDVNNTSNARYAIGVSVASPNPVPPDPDSLVIGVSDQSVWRVEVIDGTPDSALVEIDFIEENLTDFEKTNPINADIKAPIITVADTLIRNANNQ
jgi:hypothetical protein